MCYRRTYIIVFALLLAPGMAAAQNGTKSSRNDRAYTKALSLREQAVKLYDEPHRSNEIARLHLSEARFRSAGDPEAVEALILSSQFFLYAGRPEESRAAMEEAAKRALAIGDVGRAAQAYIDAAFLAERWKHVAEMKRLGTAAVLLMESPLLADEHREDLRRRMEASPGLARLLH